MRLIRLTQSAVQPVSVADARAHVREVSTLFDTELEAMIAAARAHVEAHCCRAFVQSTWAALFDGPLPVGRAAVCLNQPDVTAIDDIGYRASDGSAATISGFEWDAERRELRPTGDWPVGTDLRVAFTAGADNAANVPPDVKQAILLHVGEMFANRETHVIGQSVAELPAAARLLAPYRERMGL